VTEPPPFRRDLEGLRAVAVGLVRRVHARIHRFAGGSLVDRERHPMAATFAGGLGSRLAPLLPPVQP